LEDLAKSGYKQNMKYKILIILLNFWLLIGTEDKSLTICRIFFPLLAIETSPPKISSLPLFFIFSFQFFDKTFASKIKADFKFVYFIQNSLYKPSSKFSQFFGLVFTWVNASNGGTPGAWRGVYMSYL